MDLSEEQNTLLKKLYYDKKLFFGRDKLHQFVLKNYPDALISRRMVQTWLDKQHVYQLTKQPPPKQRISAIAIDKPGYYTVDLAGPLHRDQGYNYYLGFIEVSTRKLFTRPLKNKTAIDARDAVKDIIDKNELKVSLVRSDNGSEFMAEFTEFLKDRDIKQIYSTPASPWMNVIERYNRILKAALFKNELVEGSKAWVNVLPQITENINATWNRSLKTTANDAHLLPDGVRQDRLQNFGNMKKHRPTKSTLHTGDLVRLRIRYPAGYGKKKQTYSSKKYIVSKVIHGTDTRMVTYKISEDGVTDLKASYSILDLLLIKERGIINDMNIVQDEENDYELVDDDGEVVGIRSIRDQLEVDDLLENTNEVPKVRETRKPKPVDGENTYVIESILKRKKVKNVFYYLCKYEGYGIEHSTWERARDIQAPDLMKKFLDSIKKKRK